MQASCVRGADHPWREARRVWLAVQIKAHKRKQKKINASKIALVEGAGHVHDFALHVVFRETDCALVCFLETGLDPHAVRFTVTNLSIHAPIHPDDNRYTIIDRHRYAQPQQNRGFARIVYSAGLQPSATYIHVSVYSRF
jgi:hypothetical protein